MRAVSYAAILFLSVLAGSVFVYGQISSFQHVVLIVQENRTPDNLFQGLCLPPYGAASECGTGQNQYDIQSYGFYGEGKKIALSPVPLGNTFDPVHAHSAFELMCNPNTTTRFPCTQNTRLSTTGCPANCSFEYVDPTTTPTIYPYLYIAQNYGWANRMFQTNQGPSAPAHQFLFGGTSAPSATDDAQAVFVSENHSGLGCLAVLNSKYHLIDPAHAPFEFDLLNNPLGTMCFSRDTMATLLENTQHTWRYYTVGTPQAHMSDNIWTAPNWIQEICQPNSTFTKCTGTDWINNVDLNPADVLIDLKNCNLKNMVWVIPSGLNSDHPDGGLGGPNDGGPAWVANVINGVSNSPCKDTINGVAVPYWEDTAIIVTWDDWGGFYDHVLPPFLSEPSQGQGDYQLGFRVPLLFVSAYTKHTIDSANQYDFGSILRFAEFNFSIKEGALGFADARSTTDLSAFYSFRRAPMKFQVPTNVPAEFFLNDQRPLTPPDDD
jgi:phospholipase C